MFQFLKLANGLRAIKAAVAGKDYYAAIVAVVNLMLQLGLNEEATQLRDLVEAVKDGDYKAIAINAIELLSKGLSLIFGFPPLAVSAGNPTFPMDTEAMLCDRLDFYAEKAETIGSAVSAPAPAAPESTAAIDPAIVSGVVNVLLALMQAWLARK